MDSFWTARKEQPQYSLPATPQNNSTFPSKPFQLLGTGSAGGSSSNAGTFNGPASSDVPLMGQNLLKAYNLEFLSSRLERHDPITRVKKNKLRKSYVGKLRDRNLGFKPQAVDIYEQRFHPAVYMPEEQWEQTYHLKLEHAIHNLTGPKSNARIERALGSGVAPGRIPEWKQWSTILCMTEDQLRTDIERKQNMDRQKSQQQMQKNGSAPDPAYSNGTAHQLNRSRLDPSKPANKRRFNEAGQNGKTAPPPEEMLSHLPPSPAISDTASSTGSNGAASKKKKRVVSRADGGRIGIPTGR